MPGSRTVMVGRVLSGIAAYPLMGWFLFLWGMVLFSEPAGGFPGLRTVPQPVGMGLFALTFLLPSVVLLAADRYDWNILHDIVSFLAGVAVLSFLLPGGNGTGTVPGSFDRMAGAAMLLILMAAALVFPWIRRVLTEKIGGTSP